MELKEIKEVIRLMKTHDITDFELEKDGFKIVLRKEQQTITQHVIQQPPTFIPAQQNIEMSPSYQQAPPASAPVTQSPEPAEEKDIEYIVSPMVGTFYAAPSPESPPYVTKGQDIKPDDVVCIVEAMKVFNEIKAELSGKIIDILVENGAPVEFGQRMLKIKKM